MRTAALAVFATTMLTAEAACSVDQFVSAGDSADGGPVPAVDAGAPPPNDAATPDAGPADGPALPTFCESQAGDAGSLVACADFDRGVGADVGWTLVDQGMGSIGVDNLGSPSPPNHLHAMLPVLGSAGSGTKRIEASVPLVASATVDFDMKGAATPLSTNQVVTYVSITPNGSENALGAVRIIRAGKTWRVTSTGGNPGIRDLPALAAIESGWHHLRVTFKHDPMSYEMTLDGQLLVNVVGFAIADPTTIVFRVGAWNQTMQAAEASDEALYDNVVVRKP